MIVSVKRSGGSWGFVAKWWSNGKRRRASSNGFLSREQARARGEMFRIYGAELDPEKRRELKRVACTSAHCGCADDASHPADPRQVRAC